MFLHKLSLALWSIPAGLFSMLGRQSTHLNVMWREKMRRRYADIPPEQAAEDMLERARRMRWLFTLRACYNNIFEYHPSLYASLSICNVFATEHRLLVRSIASHNDEALRQTLSKGKGVLLYSCHGGQSATIRAVQRLGMPCRIVTLNEAFRPALVASDLAGDVQDVSCRLIPPNKYTLFKMQRALSKNEVLIVTPDISLPDGFMRASRRQVISPRGFSAIPATGAEVMYSVAETDWDWITNVTFITPCDIKPDDLRGWARDFLAKVSKTQNRPVYREVLDPSRHQRARHNLWGSKFLFRNVSNWHLTLPRRWQGLVSRQKMIINDPRG